MNRLIRILALFLATLIVAPTIAHADTPVVAQMSPEEVAQLRKQVNELQKVLGDKKTDEGTKETTMPDVADKALSLFSGAVGQVSDVIKKIAPEVWRIMIKQQYANAAMYVLVPLGLLLSSLVVLLSFRKKLEKPADEGRYDGEGRVFLAVMLRIIPACCGVWLAIALGVSAPRVINPEYYAIKDLLVLVSNPTDAP